MSFRIEQKLFINKNQLTEFKHLLYDKHATQIFPSRIIKSLYFENFKSEMYSDSIEGVTPRKKIRVRNYPEDKKSNLYLETKISSVEGRFKTRKIITSNQFQKLKSAGLFDLKYGVCKPILYVEYKREYLKIKDVRISLDNEIKYFLFSGRYLGEDENLIVELKTSIHKDLDELTNEFPLQRIRFSKYCNGFKKI